ncbi:MAG: PTS sugar transporter subunit IIB [Vallitalea sp.]|jgi:PTS system mannose-specific IIB component|nr:PTS sugar transporter subunit IIB [Vallitalea sp.]
MAICCIRIDERLIHGQVATAWTHSVEATRIMVIDDKVVKDAVQKMALKSACPMGIKLSLLNVEKATANLQTDKYDGQNVFIVVKSPEVLTRLLNGGVKFDEVIIGNMSAKSNSRVLHRTVSVTDEDVKNFNELMAASVKVNLQMVPNDKKIDIKTLL